MFGIIAVVITVPFLLMALGELSFVYESLLQVIASIYFIPKSAMDLRNSKRAACGCTPGRCRSEYLYIIFALLMVLATAIYLPYSEGCSKNEDGYSDNPDDDNYCPFPLEFNHNAVLHCIQMVAMCVLFIGVLMETESKRGKIADGLDEQLIDNPTYPVEEYPL